jgi:hypothetical protein
MSDEHTLEFLLAFDGRVHHLEKGYWLKFEIRRMKRDRANHMAFDIRSRCTIRKAGVS